MSTTQQTRPHTTNPLRHAQMLIGGAVGGERFGRDASPSRTRPSAQPIAEVPRAACRRRRSRRAGRRQGLPTGARCRRASAAGSCCRIAEALEARAEELARTIALETGNALRTQARGEANMTADIFRYFGGLGGELKGETVPLGEHVLSATPAASRSASSAPSSRGTRRCMLGALKIAPALCAGNTLVMKAAEDAPLGVLLMAEICQEFLPPGVLNVLTGYGEECGGRARQPSRRSAKLSFTGSTEVGKIDHARRRRAHRAGVARARRQEPVDRLSRRRRGLGGRRHHRRHALHPAEPELHRRLAPVPARGHLRLLPGQAREEDDGAQDRRSARRDRPTSAPSSTTSSSPRSASMSTRA